MSHRIRRSAFALFVSLGIALLPAAVGAMPGGGGGGGGGSSAPKKQQTAEEKAAKRFEQGERSRDRALAFEAKARKSDGKGFLGMGAKPSKKADKAWRKSIEAYQQAIELSPNLGAGAYTGLCLAHRKLGELAESLAAADEALKASRRNTPAVACRGETLLELGRLSEAKAAWRRLDSRDPKLAAELMQSIEAWLQKNERAPAGVSTEAFEEFRQWMESRGYVAQH